MKCGEITCSCFPYFFVKSDPLDTDIWGQDKYQILLEGRITTLFYTVNMYRCCLYIFSVWTNYLIEWSIITHQELFLICKNKSQINYSGIMLELHILFSLPSELLSENYVLFQMHHIWYFLLFFIHNVIELTVDS